MTLTEAKALYLEAKTAYYNGAPIMSDPKFDKLEDKIRAKDPTWKELAKTGVRVKDKKTEVALPNLMPSLDKKYPEEIEKWLAQGRSENWFVTNKLDGSSLQLVYEAGLPYKLYTRGTGVDGGDISYMIPHLNIPKKLKTLSTVSLRLEAVMKKSVFDAKYSVPARGETEGSKNPRNLVNGVLNRSSTSLDRATLKDVDLIVLGVYGMGMQAGYEWARLQGFNVVECSLFVGRTLTSARLCECLNTRIKNSVYEMDGLVLVGPDQRFAYDSNDKPKWTVAFKQNTTIEDAHSAKVISILWEEAKSKRLTPVAQIEPTEIGGVTVRQVTMSNAAKMCQRSVGPGAIIKVVRSGDVIPFWVATVKPCNDADLQWPSVPWEWQSEDSPFIRATEFSAGAEHQKLYHFLKTCGIENIALKTVAKLYEEAGLRTFEDYALLTAWKPLLAEKRLGTTTIGPAKSKTLVKELERLKGIDLKTVMVATSAFDGGIGDRKLTAIGQSINLTRLLSMSAADIKMQVAGLHGFDIVSAETVARGVARYLPMHRVLAPLLNISMPTATFAVKAAATAGRFAGMGATWTGYRAPEQEAQWTAEGGEIVSFGSKTTHLFYKEGGKKSTKIEKAGDRARVWAEFMETVS